MGTKLMSDVQQSEVIKRLTDILDELKIGYAIGGSIASSIYGTPRFTQDADITVQSFSSAAEQLYEILKSDFYISKEAVYQALQNKSSFNIIHLTTAFKIDIFIQKEDEFQMQMLSRSRKLPLGKSAKKVSFVSPEDIILLKLDWFRQSGCDSERQLSDVRGVLAAQKGNLDFDYLKNWAAKLSLNELLQKAMSESGAH
jgi:hypothetical protein